MIPDGLKKFASGRDILSLNDTAFLLSVAAQTIRKELHLYGHFHGLNNVKIGGRHYFKVEDIAKIIERGTE